MFHREVKKQFNENKYNVLTAKGINFILLHTSSSRCFAEILVSKSSLPKAVDRLPCPYRSWIQLHEALLHFPSCSQGRIETYAFTQWRAASL